MEGLLEEAEIVRKIFDLYIQGNEVRKIKRYLEEHGIKTVAGKSEWSTSTIDRMLSNEKYIGQVQMQKTFTADFLTGRREKNIGQLASLRISGKDRVRWNIWSNKVKSRKESLIFPSAHISVKYIWK